MGFFDELEQKEKEFKGFSELKLEEKKLYEERLELFEKLKTQTLEIREHLRNEAFSETKNYFEAIHLYTLKEYEEKKVLFESLSTIFKAEVRAGDELYCSLQFKEPAEFHKSKFFSIYIEEADEDQYKCQYSGFIHENGEFTYGGTQRGDTLFSVKQQVEKLKQDINVLVKKIENADAIVYRYKLYDGKGYYLDKQFKNATALLNDVFK
ncbi:hypothetical protein [Priestia sp. TGN 0903]|uniref:hypothetical protein n=1 Tax=Priestia sp. TGN 0903 TaxID=3420730 RepID=UPI003D77EF56